MATVADLQPGQKGIITEFDDAVLPIKLLELGCLPGNEVELVQVAPLKDPIYINLSGTHIAIRRVLANHIPVSIVDNKPSL
ncbi:FeoA family protein [Flagellimonas meridianipacifica]|uniref:Ferrous iron transport protein A n=1 Tax=Flagellimonas meridianipacifica TaxID=1080225 RepID=A0A2T0MHY9_9FLAO|nr:FeoA family protein [Allomuricauda pacifica]PRX57165.1 ferrous iron transport protein A [Allomuricauda pacifica]